MKVSDAAKLGGSHYDAGRYAEAEAIYRQIVEARPGNADMHSRLGAVLFVRAKPGEAREHYLRALAIEPDHADAHYNMGLYHRDAGELEEAQERYRRALEIKPNYHQVHNNLGNVLRELGDYTEAIDSYRRALAARPDHAAAHMNLGICLLLTGQFEEGWGEYEWRWRTRTFKGKRPKLGGPAWDGAPLEGRRILIHAEQGLGDTIQFARYAPLVAARGGRVTVLCQASLAGLLGTLDGVEAVVPQGEPVPDHDRNASIMSLPGLFGTALGTIPREIPYLRVPERRAGRLEQALSVAGGRRKIGIVWAGNPENTNDKARSCPLRHFLALGRVPGVALFSLQKEQPAEDPLSAPGVTDLGPSLDDFADTAAAVERLDLVITVDTAVAHLAGALGRPVWLALPFVPDWRWLLKRDDSPWYPSVRLFRQPRRGDWDHVFARLGAALRASRR